MNQASRFLKTFAGIVALLIAAILIAGVLGVPLRVFHPHSDEPQPRAHLNTKNSRRFDGYPNDPGDDH